VDDFLIRGLGRQHDDGLFPVLRPNPVADFIAIHAGQHDIQQYKVELARQRLCQAFGSGPGAVCAVAVKDEYVHQPGADGLFVFHDKYMGLSRHRWVIV